jgi:hypothetical protein
MQFPAIKTCVFNAGYMQKRGVFNMAAISSVLNSLSDLNPVIVLAVGAFGLTSMYRVQQLLLRTEKCVNENSNELKILRNSLDSKLSVIDTKIVSNATIASLKAELEAYKVKSEVVVKISTVENKLQILENKVKPPP